MNIWVYWDNVSTAKTPGYISLCLRSILNFCQHKHSIHFLNKHNLNFYLQNIPPELYRVERNVYQLTAKNILRRLNQQKRTSSKIAIQLDYIRLRLLYSYGGLWLDADCITMSDYSYIETALQEYEVVGAIKTTHGDNHITNGLIASNRKSAKVLDVIQAQENIMKNNKYLKWGELGGILLNEKLRDLSGVLLLDESKVLPVPWQEKDLLFSDAPLDIVERHKPFCCMLYNSIFTYNFKKKSEHELYNDNTLISKLFRKYAT